MPEVDPDLPAMMGTPAQQGIASNGVPAPVGDTAAQGDAEFVMLNDDVLTSVSNATMVLLDGSDLERMAVLYQFPQFLEHCPDETLSIMVPEIGNYAVSWKDEVQMAAAEALYFVVNMTVPQDVAKRIVVAALRIISASEHQHSGEVFDAWGEILSMMLPQVERMDVVSLVVPATVTRAESTTVESRRLAARIIGSLNDTLTAQELESKFLKQALRLCDDENASVRAMIAQSLASLGTKLPLRTSEVYLWPKLNHLMNDSNPRVRAAAMRAVARTAEAHKEHCRTSASFTKLLLPVFLRECETASNVAATDLRTVDDDTYLMLEIFSEVYGYFLSAVSPLFESEDVWMSALNSLRRMVTCNGPTVRHWCAFNVPAVAHVCGQSRPEKVRGVVQALSSDTDVETRATLALGIHKTAALLAAGPLREELVGAIALLMTDQNPQVRMNSLGHFSTILRILSATPNAAAIQAAAAEGGSDDEDSTDENPSMSTRMQMAASAAAGALAATNGVGTGVGLSATPKTKLYLGKPASGKQLGRIISSLETMSHDSWRTQQLLAQQLQKSAHLVPQDMLCEHVAPLLFQMARESTYLVRKASMSALVYVIRYIPDVRRRDHILKHFRMEWARGKVYWTRLAYIDAAEVALHILSHRLFTQLFGSELLGLGKDPVANVRLRLARLMPKIALACGTKTAFSSTLHLLMSDEKDADVAGEARSAKRAIARLPPRTAAEAKEDAMREAAEKQFFIQRQKRNKTSSSATTPSAGATGASSPASVSSSTANAATSAAGAQAVAVRSTTPQGLPAAGAVEGSPPGAPVTAKPSAPRDGRPRDHSRGHDPEAGHTLLNGSTPSASAVVHAVEDPGTTSEDSSSLVFLSSQRRNASVGPAVLHGGAAAASAASSPTAAAPGTSPADKAAAAAAPGATRARGHPGADAHEPAQAETQPVAHGSGGGEATPSEGATGRRSRGSSTPSEDLSSAAGSTQASSKRSYAQQRQLPPQLQPPGRSRGSARTPLVPDLSVASGRLSGDGRESSKQQNLRDHQGQERPAHGDDDERQPRRGLCGCFG